MVEAAGAIGTETSSRHSEGGRLPLTLTLTRNLTESEFSVSQPCRVWAEHYTGRMQSIAFPRSNVAARLTAACSCL